MRKPIRMAKLGFDTEEGTIVQWLVGIGDPVKRGQVILEVSSDKTNLDVESTESGTLAEIVHGPESVVPVGEVIGWLEVHG